MSAGPAGSAAAPSRRYTELLADRDHRLLRGIVGAVLLGLGAVVVAPLVLLPVLYLGLVAEGGTGSVGQRVSAALDGEVSASYLLYLNLSIAALIPLAMLLVWLVHGMRPGLLVSVVGRVRWRLLLACTGLALGSLVLAILVGALLPMGDPASVTQGGTDGGTTTAAASSAVLVAVVMLLTTPLQAVGEEYGYRGYLMQLIGSVARGPAASKVAAAAAVLGSALVFALAHGAQNPPLFLDRFAFGVIAGTTVVLLGGLEAGIAMHVVNNVVAFSLAIAAGTVSEVLATSEVSWWRILVTITQHGSYLLAVLWVARRLGVRSTGAPAERVA